MKKSPTVVEDRAGETTRADALSTAWQEALRLFDADLLRRGAAARTRRAYGFDCAQFALWCTTQGHRADRRHHAHPAPLRGRAGSSATSSLPRSPASSPRCARSIGTLREHGQMPANPADLVTRAQAAVASCRAS